MKSWKRIKPTIVTKVGWRTIVTKTYIMPNGKTEEFQTLEKEGTHYVAAIALTPDNQVVVSRQYRRGPEKILDELPGGGVEAGESLEEAMARELREETGYMAGELQYLGKNYYDEKSNATWHCFLATNCTIDGTGQQLDDTEFIEVLLISIEQLLQNARSAQMTEVGAVFLAYEKLKQITKHDQKLTV